MKGKQFKTAQERKNMLNISGKENNSKQISKEKICKTDQKRKTMKHNSGKENY